MAESGNTHVNGSSRSKAGRAGAPRLDFTPMVDLMFLLITFFMLTTSLTIPNALEQAMPEKDSSPMDVPDSRTLTICIGRNDQLEWYTGVLEHPLSPPSVSGFGKEGIRKVIRNHKLRTLKITKDAGRNLIVLIKPSDKSVYKNIIDLIDELNIAGVPTYCIAAIDQRELNVMKRDGTY